MCIRDRVMIVPILKLCWGNPQCRDACDFLLDTHMFLVLLRVQVANSPDARRWLETEFQKIADSVPVDEIHRCLTRFEYHNKGNLVYSNSGGDDVEPLSSCLLYTSDAADERSSVHLGGRRIIKKKK